MRKQFFLQHLIWNVEISVMFIEKNVFKTTVFWRFLTQNRDFGVLFLVSIQTMSRDVFGMERRIQIKTNFVRTWTDNKRCPRKWILKIWWKKKREALKKKNRRVVCCCPCFRAVSSVRQKNVHFPHLLEACGLDQKMIMSVCYFESENSQRHCFCT